MWGWEAAVRVVLRGSLHLSFVLPAIRRLSLRNNELVHAMCSYIRPLCSCRLEKFGGDAVEVLSQREVFALGQSGMHFPLYFLT